MDTLNLARALGAGAIACAFAGAALCQTPPLASAAPLASFTYLSAKDIEARVGHPGPNGAVVVSMIDNHEYYFSEVASRTSDGAVEQHDHWIDFITVLSGEATLAIGGVLTGNTLDAAGESHGGMQAGARILALHSGDYVQIPAGTPHRMSAPKDGFRYLVVKVRV